MSTQVLKKAPARGPVLGGMRRRPRRHSFNKPSQGGQPPDCPSGRVVKSSEGQPQEDISPVLLPSRLSELNDESRHTENGKNSTTPAGPFLTVIPKILVCEHPKVLQMQLRPARGFDWPQLSCKSCVRGTASILLRPTGSCPGLRTAEKHQCQTLPR